MCDYIYTKRYQKPMNITTKFKLGDVVYLKTDQEQLPRIITALSISGGSMNNHLIGYELSQGSDSSEHYSSEITSYKDEAIKLGI